jgi:hypothetical protein
MVAINRVIEPYELKKAKDRHRLLSNKETTGSENFTEPKGQALDKIAGFVGVSRPTLTEIERIIEAAEQNPELHQPYLANR